MEGERGEWREGEKEMKGRSRRYEVVLMRWACSRANREYLLKEGEREREVGATALHSLTSLSGCHRPVPAASFAPPVSRSRLVDVIDVMNIHRRPDTHTQTHYLLLYNSFSSLRLRAAN